MGWGGAGWRGIPYGYISILDIGYWIHINRERERKRDREIQLRLRLRLATQSGNKMSQKYVCVCLVVTLSSRTNASSIDVRPVCVFLHRFGIPSPIGPFLWLIFLELLCGRPAVTNKIGIRMYNFNLCMW